MKQCIITNYRGGYVNETLILKALLRTLELTDKDVFYISNENSVYSINDEYSHALILLDYKITTIHNIKAYLKQLNIVKVFIMDTVPEIHKDLDREFCRVLLNLNRTNLTSIPLEQFKYLYENYVDGLITFNQQDLNLLQSIYKFDKKIPVRVIPPSLGNENDIKVDFTKIRPNKSIGFNGSPSYSNGLFDLHQALTQLPGYSFNIYGNHGRSDLSNQALVNFMTGENKQVQFKGKLKDKDEFYFNHHIYYGNAKYSSFDYNTFLSLLNGMVPIIGKHTASVEYLPNYPFITDNTSQSLVKVINTIESLNQNQLNEILYTMSIGLKKLNDKNIKEHYNNFLNQLTNG